MTEEAPEELTFEQRALLAEAGVTDDYTPPTVDCPHRPGSREAEAWWRAEWHREQTWAVVRGEWEAQDTDALPVGLPPFPVHVLPEKMRRLAESIAENKCVPVDLAALLLLALTAAIAGPRVVISRRKSWTEALTEWVLVLLESGQRKSPAFTVVQSIAFSIERMLAKNHQERIDAEIAKLEKSMEEPPKGKNLSEWKKGIEAQIKALREEPPPPPRVLVGGSTSSEAIERAMAGNGGHIAIFDDEGGALAEVSGVYKNGVPTGLDTLLKGYGGARIPANERIKRATEPIGRAVLTYGLTCQPTPLLDTFRIRSLRDRGFHSRWCYAWPGEAPINVDPPDLDYKAVDAFTDVLKALANRPVIDPVTVWNERQWPTLNLTDRAWKLHVELQEEHEERKKPTGDLTHMPDWANKYVGRVLRHAGLLHLAAGRPVSEDVSEDTMRAAIAIGEWAEAHASAIYRRAPKDPRDQGDKDAAARLTGRVRVEKWITSSGKTHFIQRDVQQTMKRQTWFRSSGDLSAVLNGLAADWVVRVVPRTDAKGRQLSSAPWYVPHPDLVFGESE